MNFTSSETQRRHAFIDSALEAATDALAQPGVDQALGDYAADISDVAARLYVPNVRFGRLTVPTAYRGTDHIPVVALETGEKLRVYDDEFKERNPRQKEAALREVEGWGPPYDPVAYAQNLGSIATNHCALYARHQLTTSLEPQNIASTSDVRTHVHVPTAFLRTPGLPDRYLVKARPLLALNYSTKQADPGVMIHEYAHVVQHEREVVVAAESDADDLMHDARWELEAYYVGATLVNALRAVGVETTDYGKQVKRDQIRQVDAMPGDPFRPHHQLLDSLVRQRLGV